MSIHARGRRALAALLAVLLLCTGCQRTAKTPAAAPVQEAVPAAEDLSAAVVYGPGDRWRDTLAALENSTLADLTAAALPAEEDFSSYDMVIPDPALAVAEGPDWLTLRDRLMDYVQKGGLLVLDNSLWSEFPLDFLGISGASPLTGAFAELTFPAVRPDLTGWQEVIRDFAALYPAYYNAEELAAQDYGVGFILDGAEAAASLGELALYTFHDVGDGAVVLTNPLLPNFFSITAPSLETYQEGQAPFANTTASANRLFYGKLLAYLSMERYGYALERVYGSFGTNPLAWELHYEDITAVANGSCYQFADLAEAAGQIPSFSLVRDFYWWFLRAESITYLTNQSAKGGLSFAMDEVENAYSSGTHVLSGSGWLEQVRVENTISYFDDTGGYDQRAYPCLYDLDADGRLDILAGSSDGQLYFYRALADTDRFTTEPAQILGRLEGGWSAPAVLDIDGDGRPDIVSGTGDGRLYWFRGTGGLSFTPMGALDFSLGWGEAQVFPAAGDWNGDGVTDLAIGSANGHLALFYGQREADGAFLRRQEIPLPEEIGDWAAPCAVDLDGDGRLDIALGTFHGYVARLLQTASGFRWEGYLEGPEQNYKGNFHLKFGNNCVPAFGDVNGDGALDLVCGQLEYGLGYPIDSEHFPYRKELQEQIDWMEAKHYYVCSHALTHKYASIGYEEREFARQWEALSSYGVDLNGTGTNQHTWHTSGEGPAQTFSAQYRQGMLWNSGAELPKSEATPQVSAENVLALPFFLEEDGQDTMLLLNASTLFYRGEDWAAASARYGVPVLMYYHCDMIYKSDNEARQAVQTVSDFLGTHDYMCVREDQLAYAAAAALNTAVTASRDRDTLRLSARTADTGIALYDPAYQSAVGVKLTFADGIDAGAYTTDASVWRRMGNSLYLSLDKDVSVWRGGQEGGHLRRVNVPAEIAWSGGDLTVSFTQGGLMQAEVEGTVSTPCEGWTMTRTGENTLFTKFGEAETLTLHLW